MDDVLDFLGVVLTESDASVGAVRDAIQDEYGEAGLVHFDALVAQSDLRADDILTSEFVAGLNVDQGSGGDDDNGGSGPHLGYGLGFGLPIMFGAGIALGFVATRVMRQRAPSLKPQVPSDLQLGQAPRQTSAFSITNSELNNMSAERDDDMMNELMRSGQGSIAATSVHFHSNPLVGDDGRGMSIAGSDSV